MAAAAEIAANRQPAAGGPIRTAPAAAYRTINLLRALAATAVVWNHCFNTLIRGDGIAGNAVWRVLAVTASFGRDAVMIFFVISGYWISRSVDQAVADARWSWRDYLGKRLSRLWIVLIPALLIGLILDGGGRYVLDVPPYRAITWQGVPGADVAANLGLGTFVGNIAFLQDMAVPPWGSNAPLWTLSREFWYYIWFPTILLCLQRRIPFIALAATVATAALSLQAVLLFPCWLCGSLVHYLEKRWGPARSTGRRRAAELAVASLGWLACVIAARYHGLNYFVGCYLISGSFALFLVLALRHNAGVPSWCGTISDFGATGSFSLYCYHLPVLIAITAALCGGEPYRADVWSVLIALSVTALLVALAIPYAWGTERRTPWLRRLLHVGITALDVRRSRMI